MAEQSFDTSTAAVARRVTTGLARIGAVLRNRDWREAGERGITPTQGQILTLLQSRGTRGLRLTSIAEELAITPATVSDAVAVLVRKGLVQKTRASDDGRAVRITLTPAGDDVANQFAGWPDLLLAGVEALAPDEQRVLMRALVTMIWTLQVQRRIPVSRMCVTCQFFRPHAYSDPARPHHCGFVGAPFGDQQLQVDCPDHQLAASEQLDDLWRRFREGFASSSATSAGGTVT